MSARSHDASCRPTRPDTAHPDTAPPDTAHPDTARPVGVRAAAKARTHENLLDAALAVFASRGYGAASVEEIARTAAVSVGSVYAHFTNKETLFLALLERSASDELETARRRTEHGFDAALSLLDRRLREDAASPHRGLLTTEAWLYALRSPDFREGFADHTARVRSAVTEFVAAERTRRGVAWTMTDEEVAGVLLALFQGLVLQRRLAPASVADDQLGRAFTALLRGLEVPPG